VHAAIEAGAPLESVVSVAPEFPALVAARLQPLHQALRGLGLTAPDLADQGQRLVAVTETYVRLQFIDRAAQGREIVLDVTRNGNAFLSGRRYESALSRVSLSDAEIAATSILKIDIDRDNGVLVVTFMTFDGRPARIVFRPTQPSDPLVEGTIPPLALDSLRRNGHREELRHLIRVALETAERDGASSGFFRRLANRQVRRAYADRRILDSLKAAIADAAPGAEVGPPAPATLDRMTETLLHRLSAEGEAGELLAVRALVAIGVHRLMGEVRAD
jgi:hypothetical protein